MTDACEYCANNVQDEWGVYYCAQSADLDEDEMARYLAHNTSACPFFEAGDEYNIVKKQNQTQCAWQSLPFAVIIVSGCFWTRK